MKRLVRLLGVASLAALVTCAFAQQRIEPTEFEISGAIFGPDGKFVSGAELARTWAIHPESKKLIPNEGVKTNEYGSFKGTITVQAYPYVITVFDPERKNVAVVALTEDNINKPLLIGLKPATTLKMDVTSENNELDNIAIYLGYEDPPGLFINMQGKGELNIPAPIKNYNLLIYHRNARTIKKYIEAKHEAVNDLGELYMELSVLAKNMGKEPPAWTVSDARGISKDTQLSDLKGKWVIVEFWGYW